MIQKIKHVSSRILSLLIFISILLFVIALARGYRPDFKKKSLTPTGIIAITSSPKAAKIFVNNELKGVTDSNVTLSPGTYQIEIKKEGYTSLNKIVNLKGELVISIDALLFPLNPSLSPLTNLGIVKATVAEQLDQIILFTDNNDEAKDGVYLFDINKNILSLLPPLKPIIFKKNFGQKDIMFKDASVVSSPDFKQILLKLKASNHLLSLDEENKNTSDITATEQVLREAWKKEKTLKETKVLETFSKEIIKIASDSFHIISFSPDETKILYQSSSTNKLPLVIDPPLIAGNQSQESRTLIKGNYYIYDKKEDKNFIVSVESWSASWRMKVGNFVLWYPDSKHLMFIDKEQSKDSASGTRKKIAVIDYDGTNKQIVYSGPFEDDFFATTSDGKLIILTNLNPENNKFPDLYLVGR